MRSRLLVVAPNWLGDAVMALPALAAVRTGRPEDEMVVAGRASTVPLFTMVDGVAEVVRLESRGGAAGALRWNSDVAALRAAHADAALLLPNSFRSAWVASRAGIPERCGYAADFRGRLLTRSVPRLRGRFHQAQYYLHLVRSLGLAAAADQEGSAGSAPAASSRGDLPRLPRLHPPEEACVRAQDLLASLGLGANAVLVGLAPGAAYGKAKQWPPVRYAQLAAALERRLGATSLVFGASADGGAAIEIERELARAGGAAAVNLVGRTDLPLLVALMARCAAFVANDSGAMHVAAAAGVPVSAVFGASDERGTAPLSCGEPGVAAHEILTADAWCRPCMLRECPIDHRCMKRVDAARVAESVERQVRTSRRSGDSENGGFAPTSPEKRSW